MMKRLNGIFRCGMLATPAVLLFAPPWAEGIIRRHDVPDQEYINFGAQFPSVGLLTDGSTMGSGVLIESRWVLTAAHLSTDTNQFEIGGNLYMVEEFEQHHDWSGDASEGNDIALARLADPVQDVPPSDWYTGSGEFGEIGISVGFGRSGDGLTGDSEPPGTKRAAESLIEQVTSSPPFQPPNPVPDTLEYTFYSPDDDPDDVLPMEGMAAPGDSGGPVFIDDGDGGYHVAGIHSFLWNVDDGDLGTYGDITVSTRVAAYDDWIGATIPEPRTVAFLTGSGVLLFALWRRRTPTPRRNY